MITMPMAGCIGGDDSSGGSDEKLDDWNVHFAATAADLPTCDEDTNGRLYYVESDNQFQVCKTTGIPSTTGSNVICLCATCFEGYR